MDTKEYISNREAISYIILFSLVVIVLQGYTLLSLGSNQVSQIPLLLREIDDGYLVEDWYVNEMSGLSARFFYIQLLALFSKLIGLSATYLLFHIIFTVISFVLLSPPRSWRPQGVTLSSRAVPAPFMKSVVFRRSMPRSPPGPLRAIRSPWQILWSESLGFVVNWQTNPPTTVSA